jgi:hypothetical protein
MRGPCGQVYLGVSVLLFKFNVWLLCCWECEITHVIGSSEGGIVLKFHTKKGFGNPSVVSPLQHCVAKLLNSVWMLWNHCVQTGERKKSYATVWFVLSGSVLCYGRQFSTFCGIANVKKWVSCSVGLAFEGTSCAKESDTGVH